MQEVEGLASSAEVKEKKNKSVEGRKGEAEGGGEPYQFRGAEVKLDLG